ncbi:FliM/FliN family flagellar motor C-terminal domain-containing protein [Paracidovorax anthurii]|uniref:Type III flagellar switch regulator (C-ring) FliN n=1 Tax=Paracidovorax anthurii TaxID=78229 RepID=A0A328YQH0_9BURK|nr:FliM/FliN family flagellar motor C-terminal domain-containing protein [Paracidovorax anthurii]RAR75900.1 type III flagellar switch regulator (C-ring) FliN [Paracidovorax anthurii]
MVSQMNGRGGEGGLLSLEDSHLQARALRVWSGAERAGVRDALQALYDGWRADWGLSLAGDPEIRVADDGVVDGALDEPAARQALYSWMFGEPGGRVHAGEGGDMAEQLCMQAWESWQQRLLRVAQSLSNDSVPGESAPAPWSGALRVVFPWGAQAWGWHLDAKAVAAVLSLHGLPRHSDVTPPAGDWPPLVPLAGALDRHGLAVRVELQPVALSLGQLQMLAIGDVITLEHRLDEPALLHLGGPPDGETGVPVCASWLGQCRGQVAIELLPLS